MILYAPDGILRPAETDVSDLTDAERDGPASWLDDVTLVLPFDPEPSPDEQALIRRRLMTRDADHEANVAAYALGLAEVAGDPSALAELVRMLVRDRLDGIEPNTQEVPRWP